MVLSNVAVRAPGMSLPTSKGMIGNNPAHSAYKSTQLTALKAQNLKNAVGGSKIAVPQFHLQYSSQNGNGQDINSQVAKNASSGTQQHANAVYDKEALNMSGGNSWQYENNPNWNWGCMSGGIRKYRKSKKIRKSKKMRKSRKMRKSKKMRKSIKNRSKYRRF